MGINAEYMGTDESVEASSEAQLKVLVLTRTSSNMRATIVCVLAIMLAYSEGRPNENINSEKKGVRRPVRAAEDNDASDGFSFKWRKRRSRPIRAAEGYNAYSYNSLFGWRKKRMADEGEKGDPKGEESRPKREVEEKLPRDLPDRHDRRIRAAEGYNAYSYNSLFGWRKKRLAEWREERSEGRGKSS